MVKYIVYHGSPYKFDKFKITNVVDAVEQEGPGIYLTTSKKEAERYSKGNYVYKVEWEANKLLSDKVVSTNELYRKYLKNVKAAFLNLGTEELNYILKDWGEDLNKALNSLIETCITSAYSQKDLFLNVWVEGYRKNPQAFCKFMTNLGYDGFIKKFDGVNHIIAYNPDKIKILEVKDFANEPLVEKILKEGFNG